MKNEKKSFSIHKGWDDQKDHTSKSATAEMLFNAIISIDCQHESFFKFDYAYVIVLYQFKDVQQGTLTLLHI